MIIDGNREDLLRVILADDVVVERLLDFRGLDQAECRLRIHRGRLHLAVNDRLADIDAGVADIDAWARNDLFDLRLRFAAEGTESHARGFCHGWKVTRTGRVSSRE